MSEDPNTVVIVTCPACGHRLQIDGHGAPPPEVVHLADDLHELPAGDWAIERAT